MACCTDIQLNTGQLAAADAGNDMNVERAWLQGLTGCGMVVAVVDDGKGVYSYIPVRIPDGKTIYVKCVSSYYCHTLAPGVYISVTVVPIESDLSGLLCGRCELIHGPLPN
jgi:hypothetical protein